MRGRDERRDERGAATLWALTWAALLLVVAQLGVLVTAVVAHQHRLDAVADLAAISAAMREQRGDDGCGLARRIALLDDFEVADCRREAEDVLLVVRDTIRLQLGVELELSGNARAGP